MLQNEFGYELVLSNDEVVRDNFFGITILRPAKV